MTRHEQLRHEAQKFHDEHPDVWDLFVRFSFEKIRQGFPHYSADSVMHRVRWETGAGDSEGWKINNNYVALYARRFMRAYPAHRGFFRTRKQKSEDQTARAW